MQVARNFYLSTEKTFTRKIYEMLLALKIESLLTKEQILEVYMNQIYLGQRAYGFAAASEIYFGKPLKDITVAEAAMLAGLPQGAVGLQPDRQSEAGDGAPALHPRPHARQRLHHRRAARRGAQAGSCATARPSEVAVHAEFVAETARQLVFAQYGEEAYTRGLNVYLTIDSADQTVAYRALRKGMMDYERRQVYRGPEDYVDLPADPKEIDARIAEALADHPTTTSCGGRRARGLAEEGRRGAAERRGDHHHRRRPEAGDLGARRRRPKPKTQIRPGAVVRVMRGAKGDWTLTQLPEVEGAFVALDPRTGAIRALVGGFDYAKSKFNHVTQAWRQPGSSFKPFIYSAALEKGFTPATVVNDAPLFFDAGATGSQPWEPKNYDGKFEGPMSLRRGLAKSKNMVSIRILQVDRPAVRAGMGHPLRLRGRQAPGLPDDGAGRRLGHAAADGRGLQRVRQRRLPRQPDADQQGHRHQGPACCNEARAAGARRVDAHARCAQRLRDDQPAAGGDALAAPPPRRRPR